MTLPATTYRVIYDAARDVFPAWPVAAIGLAVALAGVALGAFVRRRGTPSAAVNTLVTSLIIFGVSWSLLVGGGLFAQHGQLRAALRDGSFVRVEGVVYDSPPGAATDAEGKSWVVESGGRAYWYRYDSSPLSVGYRRRRPGGGGLRNGAHVRIADIGGRIARLEVEN